MDRAANSTLLAMLMARPGERLFELMARLDAAIGLAWEQYIYSDEINTPRPESSSRCLYCRLGPWS